jgi:hypothetical protein
MIPHNGDSPFLRLPRPQVTAQIKVRGVFRLRNVNIAGFSHLFNCYMFRSYDHLQADIFFLELTLLTTDPLFLLEIKYVYLKMVVQLPSIDNKRYFPIFPCVVGLIGY